MLRSQSLQRFLLGIVLVAALFGFAQARLNGPYQDQTIVSLSELPPQAQQMVTLIHQGGPFTGARDGVVFGNRERLLPIKKRGYYREYTVATTGLKHRGARRIVCGGRPRVPDACYYTSDHYESFRRIAP